MKVMCRTNLDLHNEEWPHELPAVPNVGDLIQSATVWGNFQLTLRVQSVTWKRGGHYWYPEIELHFSNYFLYRKVDQEGNFVSMSVREFYEWYAPLVGRKVSSFI